MNFETEGLQIHTNVTTGNAIARIPLFLITVGMFVSLMYFAVIAWEGLYSEGSPVRLGFLAGNVLILAYIFSDLRTRTETVHIKEHALPTLHKFILYPPCTLPDLRTGHWVYMVQDVDMSGFIKIGRTNNLDDRLHRFAVKLPFETRLIHYIPCKDEVSAERTLHALYRSKRYMGEWFNLTEADVAYLLTIKKL